MSISQTRLMDIYLEDTSSSSRPLRYPKVSPMYPRQGVAEFYIFVFRRVKNYDSGRPQTSRLSLDFNLRRPLARRIVKTTEQHQLPSCRQPVAPSSTLETLFLSALSLGLSPKLSRSSARCLQTPQLRQPADHPSTPFCQLDVQDSPAKDNNITKGRTSHARCAAVWKLLVCSLRSIIAMNVSPARYLCAQGERTPTACHFTL
ncbi:hypothetical protein H112_03418 [Trichophyton rubrum D6]|uniref:Uncharacterized protein n=3 Tax=Trichophyton TaxID=5550 RepID=A0A178EWE1_TRIRU|nr:hypothetical protein H100_03423 [Trichophyton rubrum MR850]EZF42940.1 hypothetical protein H102_03418 [Trichophyton rubrum CBS 100081]EZF53630.1 hypothetical protein H103_03427 [Trichophyton rubrum CBS 288.86]EZF64207.1 hypothetical protein H104_03412 [Trichophyton rubrum CBS 289.86]EZF74874.1 hypothetical protein H105_03439 [Trichophyton soudanense CBS 452.61]EZF85503.1 hypothetical protein H110_03424 [Trichophyton rubrum MR1448]EZG17690.1 hypothetical protein H107_03534 [Trichophyton rub